MRVRQGHAEDHLEAVLPWAHGFGTRQPSPGTLDVAAGIDGKLWRERHRFDSRLVKVEPFSERHLARAADLLVGVQSATVTGPPARVSDHPSAVRAISERIHGRLGFAAVEETELVGFLLVPQPSSPGTEAVRISHLHHAADRGQARAAYRALYQAAAGQLVDLGCFDHRIRVPTEPPEPARSLVEMGFGIDQIKGLRPLSSTFAEPICSVKPAGPDDLEELSQLWIELATYHARSPILGPALIDLPGIRREIVATIGDKHRRILIAREGSRAIGMIEAHPDASYMDTVTIGLNIVTESARSRGVGTTLIEAVMRWGQSVGCHHCAVSWASANLVSDAFYRARAFQPVRYELARRIDPRVSWANETLDFSLFAR